MSWAVFHPQPPRKRMRVGVLGVLLLVALTRVCPGEQGARCAQVKCLASCLPLPMIKDMIKTMRSISKPWPKLNIADINRILGIYEEHVFKKLWRHDVAYPEPFIHFFYRLRVTVERCKDQVRAKLTRYARKKVKGMEEAFKELRSEERSEAAGDFDTVLRWISVFMDRKLSQRNCQ